MKFEGEALFQAAPERVWDVLNDPDLLKKHLPGCESLEKITENEFQLVLVVGVGAIKGTYKTRLRIVDSQPPERYTLQVDGSGRMGFVKGEGHVHVQAAGEGSKVRYEGELHVGGTVARVGMRLLENIAQKMTRRFFEDLAAEA